MLLKSEVLWIQKNVVCTVSYFHMIDGKLQLRDFTRRLLGYLWFLGYLKLEWETEPLGPSSTEQCLYIKIRPKSFLFDKA